jgi:hypothetical protein
MLDHLDTVTIIWPQLGMLVTLKKPSLDCGAKPSSRTYQPLDIPELVTNATKYRAAHLQVRSFAPQSSLRRYYTSKTVVSLNTYAPAAGFTDRICFAKEPKIQRIAASRYIASRHVLSGPG